MKNHVRLKQLEDELDQLRGKLYQVVGGTPSQLRHPHVLPISQQLDHVIVELLKEQEKQKSRVGKRLLNRT